MQSKLEFYEQTSLDAFRQDLMRIVLNYCMFKNTNSFRLIELLIEEVREF